MKNRLPVMLGLAVYLPILLQAQEPMSNRPVLEFWGDRTPEKGDKLASVWLFPEGYDGYTLKLHRFVFEAENFEYFPELNGYLFSCEPVPASSRLMAYHSHVGKCDHLSREKLNFFCASADGQRIRETFRKLPDAKAINASVVLEVRKRKGIYFADLVSFTSTVIGE